MALTPIFTKRTGCEIGAKVTTLRLTVFLINVALLVHLVLAKRLLGVRGSEAAHEARLRSESVMQAAMDAAAADAAASALPPPSGAQANP